MMNDKTISSLKKGETCFMFGGFNQSAGEKGTEVTVTKVGNKYLYARRSDSAHSAEHKFDRVTGMEAADSNYKRFLMIDREAYIANQKAQAAFTKLRQSLSTKLPEGVTLADIEAAAVLLGVNLNFCK